MAMLGRISGAVNIPWREITCLGHGHTITCGDALPGFPAVFLADTRRLPDLPAPDFRPFMGDPVTLLWAVPITQKEYDVALQSREAVLPMLYQGRKEEMVIFTGEGKFLGDR